MERGGWHEPAGTRRRVPGKSVPMTGEGSRGRPPRLLTDRKEDTHPVSTAASAVRAQGWRQLPGHPSTQTKKPRNQGTEHDASGRDRDPLRRPSSWPYEKQTQQGAGRRVPKTVLYVKRVRSKNTRELWKNENKTPQ